MEESEAFSNSVATKSFMVRRHDEEGDTILSTSPEDQRFNNIKVNNTAYLHPEYATALPFHGTEPSASRCPWCLLHSPHGNLQGEIEPPSNFNPSLLCPQMKCRTTICQVRRELPHPTTFLLVGCYNCKRAVNWAEKTAMA